MKISGLIATVALASAAIVLQPERKSIFERGLTSWGGYALLVNPCPTGTSTCGTASCCPTGYTCNTNGSKDTPLCCPSSTDCTSNVQALNACADQSWELYTFGGLFCCAPDSVGTWSSAGRQCIAKSLPIPSSISLSTVTQVTGTVAATGVASGTKSAGAGQITSSGPSTSPGTTVLSGTGSSSTSGSGGSSSSSSKSGLPQPAIIAIAVLATIIVMLTLFIYWRFSKNRNKARQAPNVGASMFTTQTSQLNGGAYATSPVFKRPEPRVGELSGNSAPGPIYETGVGQHIELDGGSRRM